MASKEREAVTLSRDMLQAARGAANLLHDAGNLVVEFLRSQMTDDGGFRGRSGTSDLYYTVFGLEGLLAMDADVPFGYVERYLRTFGSGHDLDLVHLACLARCWSHLPAGALPEDTRGRILNGIERHRGHDGGYGGVPDAEHSTVYGCFLALAAYQDLGQEPPSPMRLARCLECLRSADGAYANERGFETGSTSATAAAAVVLRHLVEAVPDGVADWLLARCLPGGGFAAMPETPVPDLLSTATAVHALAAMNVSLDAIRGPCIDFIDSLWTSRGGFYGHWADDVPDCEYTYYGLLALGHLD